MDKTKSVVDLMVDRFLCWKLPSDFGPDGGIQFNRSYHSVSGTKEREYGDPFWPVGTNLLTADQARAMILHMFNTDDDRLVVLKPPIGIRFENLVRCAHALDAVMQKLKDEAGSDDPFAFDKEWEELASEAEDALQTVKEQK